MALIKCPECGKEISDQAKSCPNCGYLIVSAGMAAKEESAETTVPKIQPVPVKKGGCLKGCLIVIIGIALFIGIAITFFSVPEDKTASTTSQEEANSTPNSIVEQIINLEDYSRISSEQLFEKLGEEPEGDSWTNKTGRGDFELTTYEYDKDNIHYEFIVAEDIVVRVTVYSQQYWSNQGELFKFNELDDIFPMFGISKGEDLKKVADTNSALIYSPVSDKVAKIDIQDISKDNATFGFIKITYNLNYFD